MPSPDSIHIPTSRTHRREDCGDRAPAGRYICNRPAGHTGRHHFAHRHVDGTLRAVWV